MQFLQTEKMPINIYNDINNDKIEYLCEDIWDLPTQISELEKWLAEKGKELPMGKYVADIGFDIRKNASGGGGIINTKMINIMSGIGIEVYLSEYPGLNKK